MSWRRRPPLCWIGGEGELAALAKARQLSQLGLDLLSRAREAKEAARTSTPQRASPFFPVTYNLRAPNLLEY